ncbi:unnamed protein product [Phaedon cochleariae]|uniref:Protamine-like n=1 Tax=Phaedon cochleariae TaxID=80249 RepID=A0A9P0DL01_PHACE|nr:unnamed protein product [Phaedon cochleariae]
MKRLRNDNTPDDFKSQSNVSDTRNTNKYRTGRVTCNPFLNFMRDMRKNSRGMTITQMAVKGADIWKKMDFDAKQPYCLLAKQARSAIKKSSRRKGRKKRRRGSRFRTRSRARSHSRSRKRSRSRRSRSRSRRKSRRRN